MSKVGPDIGVSDEAFAHQVSLLEVDSLSEELLHQFGVPSLGCLEQIPHL